VNDWGISQILGVQNLLVVLFGVRNEAIGFVQCVGEGLFDNDRGSALQRINSVVKMLCWWRRDDDDIGSTWKL